MSILRSTLNRPTLFTPQVNVTGQFHNLTSSGTFPLPGDNTRSSGPSGAVQLSNGNGGFINDGQLYVQNGLVLDNSMITDNTQKPFVLALTSTGQTGYVPNPSVDKEGDIFFGAVQNLTTSFYGYKTGGWVDLAGAGGGGSGSSAPLNSIQFAGAGSVFQSSPLYGFYKGGQNLPSGPPLGPDQNALIIGSTAGQGSALPNATTQINYVSDSTEQVQFVLSKSGLQIELPNSGNNQEFYLETKEIGITTQPPVVIQTRDGNMNFQSFRQTNGGLYGEGSINLLTNSGGIILQSRGKNSGGGTATGVDGGLINLDSQDGNILLHSTRKSANKSVELRSQGAFGNVTTDSGILLNSIQAASGAPSISSGKITLQTEGGSIDLSTTTGSQGLTNSGSINLSTAVGDIKLNAKGIARNIELTAEGSILARTRLEIQNTTNPSTATTTVTINGQTGDITTTIGDITANTGDITATAGTVKGNQLESTTTTEVGTDLTVENDAIIGNTGGGSFTVKTTNTTVGLPALRTYSTAGVDQTQLGAPIVLSSASTTVLNPTSGLPRRFPNVSGAMAYDDTLDMISYTSPGVANPATIVQKYLGNKVLLKTVQCTESLSINNSASNNGPDLANPISYSSGGGTSGYQSGDTQRNYDLAGNCFATMIGVAGTAGGTKSIFCLKVQMPPRRPGASAANPEYSILIEGTCCFSFRNPNGSSAAINLGFGAYATDALTPAASANAGGIGTAVTDPWQWGSQLFFTGGGLGSYPRPMHASYYKNLADANIPSIDLSNVVAQQFPAGWLDSQKPNAWVDWQGSTSSNNQAGLPNAGSYFRQRIASGQYEIKQVPFSMLCQNTNDTSTVQTQYIWVTATDAQSSGNFTAVAYRDGYYGFASSVIGNFYGGNTNCSVYYLGDPNLGNITSDDA